MSQFKFITTKDLRSTIATEGRSGELRSMRTSARHLRQGAAQAILTELLNLARQRGYARRPGNRQHAAA